MGISSPWTVEKDVSLLVDSHFCFVHSTYSAVSTVCVTFFWLDSELSNQKKAKA